MDSSYKFGIVFGGFKVRHLVQFLGIFSLCSIALRLPIPKVGTARYRDVHDWLINIR